MKELKAISFGRLQDFVNYMTHFEFLGIPLEDVRSYVRGRQEAKMSHFNSRVKKQIKARQIVYKKFPKCGECNVPMSPSPDPDNENGFIWTCRKCRGSFYVEKSLAEVMNSFYGDVS